MPAHILVVDDDAQQRADLAEIVRSLGYEVTTAADGGEALSKLASVPASAILTDLVMPGMDGVALLKELAARGDRTPAVVLTGFGSIDQAISFVHDLKAFWFLEKPVQPGVVRTLLERAIQQNQLVKEAERLHSQLSYQGILGDLVGDSRVHEGSVLADPAGGADHGIGADQRRERHRQGTGGARDSHAELAERRAFRGGELRRPAGEPDGERTLRP